MKKNVFLIASGDLRLSTNRACQEAQAEMEKQIIASLKAEGVRVIRAHPYDPTKRHGFIDSQKHGIAVFRSIPADAPLIVAEAVWQYSHHVLPGLQTHKGPILTLANWSGTWPGLVGMLNLNGCLTKTGVNYSTLWSENFDDSFYLAGLRSWLRTGKIRHDTSHVVPLRKAEKVPRAAANLGRRWAAKFKKDKGIMGIFDEGCMGMSNAIIPDELLNPTGLYKERLSQSTLYARMLKINDADAKLAFQWLVDRGMNFNFGTDEATELTKAQVLQQMKMYIAAVRLADEFGCATIGIQYQQGLKDLAPASDLVEGLLNNVERPPVYHEQTGAEIFPGEALPHFNEVDECAGLDALVTNRIWRLLGFPPENTLHDIRWGRQFKSAGLDAYVWVLLISGAVPPAHFVGGYRGASSERQPAMYFALGGGTCKGVSKPGAVVWSRVFIANGRLCFDTGLAEAVALPTEETEERWRLTTSQWPIMHAVLKGVSRDQMMARHKANHIHVAYAPDAKSARQALFAKASAMAELGLTVSLCGDA